MDQLKYEKLRKKNSKKDFEQSNKWLDWWLFNLSFVGNILSIFFAVFLVYPKLLSAVEINISDGIISEIIAITITLLILVAIEAIKRYVIRNFSNEFLKNRMVFKSTGWLITSVSIQLISFYMSVVGSKNLGNIGQYKKDVIDNQLMAEKIRITNKYDSLIAQKNNYILELIEINKKINEKIDKTPLSWEKIKNGYRLDIKNNDAKIDATKNEINVLYSELEKELSKIEQNVNNKKNNIDSENVQSILLFIIIAIINEFLVFSGIHFREWYEYKLFILNQHKYEKRYLKRDRFRLLTVFLYKNGQSNVGDVVLSGIKLKEIIKEKTTILPKIVDEYFNYMDSNGVFNVVGKRRYFAKTFDEAIDIVDNFDDISQIFDEMR